LAHDKDHWFISQEWGLWRIPVGLDLAATFGCGEQGAVCADLSAIGSLGYDHLGDIDYYQYSPSTGFLLVPLENNARERPPAIAALNPVSLQMIDHTVLRLPEHMGQPKNAPWVAIDPEGFVFLTDEAVAGRIYRYHLAWDTLAQSGTLSLTYVDHFQLLDESGSGLGVAGQGAAFSESGDLLYTNNGYYKDYNSGKDGISVFDMGSKRRIAYSSMDSSQHFWYGYDPGYCDDWSGTCNEEPEGLTIWDLDDGRAPGISGQLHVVVLDNDLWEDDIYIRNYTNKIYVDRWHTGGERGTPSQPFNTVGEALNMAWPGSRISIKGAPYPESPTFAGRMQVYARDGMAVVGTQGGMALSPPGTVSLGASGMLRIH
jgi:hypothetical protein